MSVKGRRSFLLRRTVRQVNYHGRTALGYMSAGAPLQLYYNMDCAKLSPNTVSNNISKQLYVYKTLVLTSRPDKPPPPPLPLLLSD